MCGLNTHGKREIGRWTFGNCGGLAKKTLETVCSKWCPKYSMSVVFLGLEYSCRVNTGFSKDLWAHGESENYLHYRLEKSS